MINQSPERQARSRKLTLLALLLLGPEALGSKSPNFAGYCHGRGDGSRSRRDEIPFLREAEIRAAVQVLVSAHRFAE